MAIKEIGVNISKKISRVGEFGSDMVSASITMTVEDGGAVKEVYDEAWGIVKEEVAEQEKQLQLDKEFNDVVADGKQPEVKPEPAEESTAEPSQKSYCELHHMEMKERNSSFGKFYSHATQQDNKWVYCTGKGWGVK